MKDTGDCYKCDQNRWWGNKCTNKCGEGCVDGTCGMDTGNCQGDCRDGFWGMPRCTETCNSNCKGPDGVQSALGIITRKCGVEDGRCYHGCSPGWCWNDCSLQCPDGTVGSCDRTTGLPEACEGGTGGPPSLWTRARPSTP